MTKHTLYFVAVLLICSCNFDRTGKDTLPAEKVAEIPSFNLVGQELPSNVDRQFDYTLLQAIAIDINKDEEVDTILIEKITRWTTEDNREYEWTDPGDFHRITIAIQGKKAWTCTNIDGWVNKRSMLKYDKVFDNASIIESDHVIVRNEGKGNILVYIAGYTYASSPGLLTIISIYNGVDTKLIFNQNVELFAMKDFNSDGINDLITTVWDGYYSTTEENNNRHKVYLLNGGFSLSSTYSQQFCDQFN